MRNVPTSPIAGDKVVHIKAQLATANDPIFPFSSPTLYDRSSPESSNSSTTYTLQSQNSFRPARLPRSHAYNVDSFQVSESKTPARKDDKDFRGVSALSSKERTTRKRSRPELQILTTLPPPQSRKGKVVFNQVAVHHAEEGYSKAISVVSQKGVNVLPWPSPPKDLSQVIRNATWKTHEVTHSSKTGKKSTRKPTKKLSTKNSVVFGLSVPEHQATLNGNGDGIKSAVTILTPNTPKIVVTPAADYTGSLPPGWNCGETGRSFQHGSPTSSYSSISLRETPLENVYQLPTGIERKQRHNSLDSQQQILADSCDTARPKSQGWWNLMLSPVLSRMGTLRNQKEKSGDNVPPVPAVPPVTARTEKGLPLQTPITIMSPETPRRLGLANVRTSTWSHWTELEDDQNLSEEEHEEIEAQVPTEPKDWLPRSSANANRFVSNSDLKGEGLAAEYYHACAVEQLTNVTYFECVNHSCVERLPKLCSIFDSPKKKMASSTTTQDKAIHMSQTSFISDQKHVEDNSAMPKAQNGIGLAHGTMQRKVKSPSQSKCLAQSPLTSDIDPEELVSPNIRQANTATFSKAKTVNSREPSPVPSSTKTHMTAKQTTIEIAPKSSLHPSVDSPGPLSPEATRAIAPVGALPMAPFQSQPADKSVPLLAPIPHSNHALVPPYQPQPAIFCYPYGPNGSYQIFAQPPQQYPIGYELPPPTINQMDQANLNAMLTAGQSLHIDKPQHVDSEQKRDEVQDGNATTLNKEDTKATKTRTKNRFGVFCCIGERKPKKKNSRFQIFGIATLLLIIIAGCILFAILFTRGKGDFNPIESRWLNLTGFPPIPTGISTIARPNLAASQNQCTQPTTMWSCSLPKEDQAAIKPNNADQPNFRFQIRFRNGTVPASMTIPLTRRAENPSADDLFVPNPTPPGLQDQIFLGNTTDNVTKPFNGEATPFFITFMGTNFGSLSTNSAPKLITRQAVSNISLESSIPAPSIGPDGSAAPATLLPTAPFPISQPIKLYNRGQRDEHYGFYIYYDKSIFLSGVNLQNGTSSSNSLIAIDADKNGGSTKQGANVRCTWSQTRFVVKMFTSAAFGASLLQSPNSNGSTSKQVENSTSSASNFDRPGSFPYPTTILLDRHGGDVNKKLVYCYGMNGGNIVNSAKVFVSEVRKFGGVPINQSPTLLSEGDSSFDSSLGGIDGGTGGCGCTWQNWV